MIRLTKETELQYCCQILAGECDGAASRDGKGFNKYDAQIGRRMANIPQKEWSELDRYEMYWMLNKYKGQLEAAGVEWAKITRPVKKYTTEKIHSMSEMDKF